MLMTGLLIMTAAMVSGCATSRKGRIYGRDEARAIHTVRTGVIQSVEEVTIEGTKTPIGPAAGGILGGVLGRSVGGGSGKNIATVAGALGGAAAGAAAEEGVTRTSAWELTVKMDDTGDVVSIIQAKDKDESFAPGDKVRVLEAKDGSVRVRK